MPSVDLNTIAQNTGMSEPQAQAKEPDGRDLTQDAERFTRAMEQTRAEDNAARGSKGQTDVGNPENTGEQAMNDSLRVESKGTFAAERAKEGASPKEAERFASDLAGDERKTEQHTGNASREPVDTLFKDFSGLFGPGQVTAGAAETAAAENPSAAGALSDEALESVVSRILVNSPQANESEVRLTISDEYLRDTEISIIRDKSTGELSVRIASSDQNSLQTLIAAQHDLRDKLQMQEKAAVDVRVSETGTEREGSDTARHESRGRNDSSYQEG